MCLLAFFVAAEFPFSVSPTFFFFNDTATTEIYTLSLHDALPICRPRTPGSTSSSARPGCGWAPDRKSTRLNSSHVAISYAVFCLKKKNNTQERFVFNTDPNHAPDNFWTGARY